MTRTRILVRTATAVLAGAALGATPLAAAANAAPARELAPIVVGDAASVIPGSYIVVLEAGASLSSVQSVADVATRAGATVDHTYGTAIQGFAATMSTAAVDAVRAQAGVAYVAPNQTASLQGTQKNPTWGIDRVDQRKLPLDKKYKYKKTGKGITTYVIDTGINSSHKEFTGRLGKGEDFIGDGRGTEDCNGHGTHVAGTVGGTTYGVAKKVTIVPVRVIACGSGGDWGQIIAGIDWVADNHTKVSNATMSIGGGTYAPADQAAAGLVAEGVAFTIAAANASSDACNYSPAREPSVITIAASTINDAQAGFSNYGRCVDLYAPGENITSAWIGSSTATNTISGTSMAAPHVAGAVALRLVTKPNSTPKQLADYIIKQSTKDEITNPGSGTPNRLLYTSP